MECLSFDPLSKTLTLKKTSIPIPKPDEVRIKVAYSGICGTDLHILEGAFTCKDDGPFVLGHEFCGTVDEIGSAVTNFKIGQRVTIDPNDGCHKCTDCHIGNYHFCRVGGLRNTIGIYRNGGWATHVLVPESQIHLIPDKVQMHQAALTEPLSCLAHGLKRIGTIHVGNQVLIIGAGIIGLFWSCLLHLRGLRNTVTISEPQEKRRKIASKLGLNYKLKEPNQLANDQFDLVVDCSGSGPAMETAMQLLKPGGCLCMFGVANPKTKMSIEPYQIFKKELSIVGVNINPHTFPRSLSLLEAMADQYLDFDKLGIKVYTLSQYREALETLKKGDISKAIFKL
ncbi:D-arabinitol dehydrogenase 1-like [Vespula maculifrons]|uniref:D-arabinitol dehydrogenase 1-like n=1 Tax=Vespula maculifrons TaxID=7453 RepID=A0ABD2C3H4_VESMC